MHNYIAVYNIYNYIYIYIFTLNNNIQAKQEQNKCKQNKNKQKKTYTKTITHNDSKNNCIYTVVYNYCDSTLYIELYIIVV